jgi:hypothetical protein
MTEKPLAKKTIDVLEPLKDEAPPGVENARMRRLSDSGYPYKHVPCDYGNRG